LIADPASREVLAHRIFLDRNRNDKYDALLGDRHLHGRNPFRTPASSGARNPLLTRSDLADLPADPFLLRTSELWHMFFEVLNCAQRQRGNRLGYLSDAYNWSYRQIAFAEPFHLSYPYRYDFTGTRASLLGGTLVQVLLTGKDLFGPVNLYSKVDGGCCRDEPLRGNGYDAAYS
jgi:hypothetical protein